MISANFKMIDGTRHAAAVAALAFAAMFCVSAWAADIPTQWQGSYAYDDGRPAVPFTATIIVNGGVVSGRITEPATFGDGTSPQLYANLSGSSDGYSISFIKTYDGHGGQTHSVAYSGTISGDGRSMSGTWRLSNLSGTWSVTALNQASGGCIIPSSQFRTTDGWIYWDFQNRCDHIVQVNVCKFSGNNQYNPLGVGVPAHQNNQNGTDSINLGLASQGPFKVTHWNEGNALPCP